MKVFNVLIVSSFITVIISSCGDAQNSPQSIRSQSSGASVAQSNTTIGASIPTSYTMIDTPDANICVDAFNRMGITLPDSTVARSINSFNIRANGVAWQDLGSSMVPVLNILHLDSTFSNVVFQLLNPVGFYCIIRNNAQCSNVTIQRKCSAVIAQIEPIIITTINTPPVYHRCGLFDFRCRKINAQGTTSSINSQITETQCIP